MFRMGFEPMISVLERARAATRQTAVIGTGFLYPIFIKMYIRVQGG
jgi:hypothetical protein